MDRREKRALVRMPEVAPDSESHSPEFMREIVDKLNDGLAVPMFCVEGDGDSALTVPDLGPPLPESSIPAVPPAEAPKPSAAELSEAIVRGFDSLASYEEDRRRAVTQIERCTKLLDAAYATKAAQMLADGTRLVSIGGVTYEARKGRKGAAPTLVPVKVEE